MDFASVSDALRAQRAALCAIFGFSFALNLLLLVSPLYMMLVFDHVLTSRSAETLLVLTAMAAFALAFYGVFDALRAQLLARIGLAIESGLGAAVLRRALAIGRRTPPGTTAHAMRDLTALRAVFAAGAASGLMDAPWAALFAAALFVLHPLLGIAATLSALLLVAIAALGEAARRPARAIPERAAALADWTEGVTRNAETVAGLGMTGDVGGEWRRRSAALAAAQIAVADRDAIAAAAGRCARMLMQVAILALGAALVLRQELGAGSMVAASLLLARMLAPVEGSIASWRLVAQARLAARRLEQLLALPEASAAGRMPGGLMLEDVALVAPGTSEPQLRPITFRLEPGESLGILGPSASGKSTLTRLLAGAVAPTSGRLHLDGSEIECGREPAGARRLGYLPQELLLLPGSIGQNIAGFREAAAEALLEAATLAGVHERILQLPLGYDTPIAAGGRDLPAGLRQGIALARACFGTPALIVLDEPTAHLDGAGREALMRALARLRAAGVMLAVVSREPALIERMDKLALLNRGRMVSFGPRAEVLARLGAPQPEPAETLRQGLRRLA